MTTPAQPPLVMVVDDDEGARTAIGALLEVEGHRLVLADRGDRALEQLRDLSPDVVLLDVMMPGIDGFETCRRLKADPRLRHVPVIMVTALADRAHLVKGLDAGADEFVSKPVSGVELRARVRSMLRIKRQWDELGRALRLREELAHMIVHDMRTPLASILGYAELLLARDDPATRGQWLERVRLQATRLSRFTDEILLVSKLEEGKLRLDRQPVDLGSLAEQVRDDLKVQAEARRIQLVVDRPEARLTLSADSGLLRRVLENLVSNAIKFSPTGTNVLVRVQPRDGGARLAVVDEGPGVPEEARGRLFEKFAITDLKKSGVRQTGLGLYLVRLVAEAHGGAVAVEPNQPRGSVFSITL